MRKPFNIILLNISIADMMACFAAQPYVWIDYAVIQAHQNLSEFFCAISFGVVLLMTFCCTTTLNLCGVTVLRYVSIVWDYRGYFVESKKFMMCLCVLTWIAGISINIPQSISHRYNNKVSICYMDWPEEVNVGLFILVTVVVFGILPLLLMLICYVSLAAHIWRRSIISSQTNIAAYRARKSVTILLGLLILAFVLCWAPFVTILILGRALNYFSDGVKDELERQRRLRIALIFVVFNSFLDPFIYVFSAMEYRKALKKLIDCFWRRKDAVIIQRDIALR